jgi:hypothetical protein
LNRFGREVNYMNFSRERCSMRVDGGDDEVDWGAVADGDGGVCERPVVSVAQWDLGVETE